MALRHETLVLDHVVSRVVVPTTLAVEPARMLVPSVLDLMWVEGHGAISVKVAKRSLFLGKDLRVERTATCLQLPLG